MLVIFRYRSCFSVKYAVHVFSDQRGDDYFVFDLRCCEHPSVTVSRILLISHFHQTAESSVSRQEVYLFPVYAKQRKKERAPVCWFQGSGTDLLQLLYYWTFGMFLNPLRQDRETIAESESFFHSRLVESIVQVPRTIGHRSVSSCCALQGQRTKESFVVPKY